MALDSEPDALRVQRAVWRRMGPNARIRLSVEMSEEARRIALAGAMRRDRGLSEAECQRKQIQVLYGIEDLMESTE